MKARAGWHLKEITTMKKLFLFTIIVLSLSACKKEDNSVKVKGTKFDYVGSPLSTLVQIVNGVKVIPTNPFVIDQLLGTYSGADGNFYKATSSNGLTIYVYQSNMNFDVQQ
jgi:hypothetical protein